MSDYSTNASVNLQINGKQAEETLSNLKKAALNLTDQIAKAAAAGDKVTLKKLRKELNDTKRQIKEMESATMQVDSVLRHLDKASPKDLQKTLTTLTKQLDYMERGSETWNVQARKIRLVKEEIAKVNGELARSQSFLERVNTKWQQWQTVAMGSVAAFTGTIMAGKKAVQMYAEMEQEMASVRKYTGMTAEQIEVLNEEFKKINTRSGRDELNRLAQEAGRLGKSTQEEVLGFVKAADQINVALDELGEGATLQLSKLTSIFGDEARLGTERSLLAVGSVINELSQNCTAGAAYLASFGQRLAGVGAQAGMTVPQIMAFGAVLDSQGQKVEMSATALSKLIMNLYKNTEKIAAATGMDLEKFNAALKSSTNEGLIMLLNRLHELGDMSVLAPVFKDMGENGARASAVISALAGNIDMLVWEQEEAQKAFEEATSVTKEFEIQNNTVQAGLDKARKGFKEMAIALGEELVPVMRHFISSTSATMRVMLLVVRYVKEHREALLSLSAAIATYTIAVNLALIKEKTYAALLAVKTAAMHLHRVAVLASAAAYNRLTGNVTRASAAMKLLHTTMKMNPWGLVASAIIGVSVALAGYIKKQKEITAAQKATKEVEQEMVSRYAEQKGRIDRLSAAIRDERRALVDRQKALVELRSIIPSYHAELTTEGRLIKNNKEAIEEYLVALNKEIAHKAYQDKLQEQYTKRAELEMKLEQQTVERTEKHKVWQQIEVKTDAAGNQSAGSAIRKDIAWNKYLSADREVQQTTTSLREVDEVIATINKKVEQYSEGMREVKNVTVEVEEETEDNGTDVVPDDDNKKGKVNKFQAEDDWKEKEQALNRIAYAKGEADYEAYTRRTLEIDVEYNRKKLEHKDLVGNEEVTIQAAYYEAQRKQQQNFTEGTVQQEEQAYNEVMVILHQRYMDGELSARQYQNAIELAELEHLRKVVNIYDENSKERIKAEKRYHDTSLKYQQHHLQEDKKLQEQFRQQYFTRAYITPDTESYARNLKALELIHSQMLQAAGTNAKERLQVERAFQEAKYQLGRKYNIRNARELKRSFREAVDDIADWLKSDGGKAFTGALDTVLSGMSAIFSGVSDLVQAELDIETAKIEASYSAQLSAAEGNKTKEIAIEHQKQMEIGKAKQEANKKMFAMQVIQAVAQTAQSAIAAYSSAAAIPMVGFIMAPIAAAMAIAAGAIQIASIKKQQQASESVGYSQGGFTKPGREDEPAGVVHAGEWVASQQLLRNPEARAIVETLDYAQRTNTIGRLSAADVSQSITAPQRVAKAQQSGELLAIAAASEALSRTVSSLKDRLNEPFVTINTVTGDAGIKKAQDDYNRLIRNKTPKSRR